MNGVLQSLFHVDETSVYLSPAPMYHSAPIGFCSSVQSLGGTVVMMDRFDPVDALRAMEKHAVTHSQWVPTMFTRMLKLPRRSAPASISRHTAWRSTPPLRVRGR
jgi:fatty-acyl-CoA synthase